MSSRKIRALRNRQDRTRFNSRVLREMKDPSVRELDEDIIEEKEEAKQEPLLNLNSEPVRSAAQEQPSSSFNVKINPNNLSFANAKPASIVENFSISGAVDEDDDAPLSPLELARRAVQENHPQQQQPEAAGDAPKSEAPDENTAPEEKLENIPDFAENSSPKEILGEDPDMVPVSTTFSDDEVPNRAGAILLHAREILGLSQREVAHKLNLRVNSVSDIEHDRLNQPTAVPFASVHIANYAKLVNIEPQFLVDLYKKAVRENVMLQEETFRREQHKAQSVLGSGKGKFILGGILVLAAIVVTAAITSSVLSSSSNRTSGALVIEDTVEASSDGKGNLVMDTENSKLKTNVIEEKSLRVDLNTQKAQAQAQDLDTKELISNHNLAHTDVIRSESQVSLNVKGKAAEKMQKAKNKAEELKEVIEPQENSLKSVNLTSAEASSKSSQNEVKNETEKKPDEIKTAPKTPAADNTALKKTEEAKTAETKIEQNAPAPKETLSANTRDISSSVRLLGKRDPFESMNTVSIRITGEVALRVTGSGKLLKQGSFKAGDKLKVTGIPPLKVSVSDSSKVRLTYMGTGVSVPNSKQVSFTLPTK